jgi:hypothetical protein
MKLIMLMVLSVSLFSCSGSSIDVNKIKLDVATKISSGIAVSLQCKQETLIREDILALLKYEASGDEDVASIGGTICAMAVKTVLPTLLKMGIPSKWECSANNAGDLIKVIGERVCGLIP